MKNPVTFIAACAALLAVGLSVPALADVVSKNTNEARPSASSLSASAQAKIGQKDLKAALPDLMKAMDIEPANVGLQRCAATVIIAIDDEIEGRPGQMGSYCSGRLR